MIEDLALQIPLDDGRSLEGDLVVPDRATGLVVFAHGSGSSRFSSRNRAVAEQLRGRGIGTLLFDLLTTGEEAADAKTGHLRFDIELLAQRLLATTRALAERADIAALPLGYFGASTGAAAALVAVARMPDRISAVVSRGGRPDLAAAELPAVRAPTLLIVGGRDDVVVRLNQQAFATLTCERRMEIVPGATHLFEEPGALNMVAALAGEWFASYLQK